MTTTTDILTVKDIAAIVHDANRRLQLALGDPNPSQPWGDAHRDQALSSVDAVRELLADPGLTAEDLWRRWCTAKFAAGWTLGRVKDYEALTHPCLVERYDQLPRGERLKDELYVAIVRACAAP